MTMASTNAHSTSLTRYPRWVWVITGLTAAYATYTIWSLYSDTGIASPASSGLHRRGAVRHSRRRSPQGQDQQLLANTQPSSQHAGASINGTEGSPLGTITASVNNREYPSLLCRLHRRCL